MGIVSWIVLGLIVGVLAQWIMPGAQKLGLIWTCVLGVGGALIGGFVAALIGWGGVGDFSIKTIALSVAGALLVLYVFPFVKDKLK